MGPKTPDRKATVIGRCRHMEPVSSRPRSFKVVVEMPKESEMSSRQKSSLYRCFSPSKRS